MFWFISQDKGQAAVVAREIPHYGKYSYLLFDGAVNQSKEIWVPTESPLRIDFTLNCFSSFCAISRIRPDLLQKATRWTVPASE